MIEVDGAILVSLVKKKAAIFTAVPTFLLCRLNEVANNK